MVEVSRGWVASKAGGRNSEIVTAMKAALLTLNIRGPPLQTRTGV